MQRGNAIGKYLGGIIAIALGDVPWMNKILSFLAETRLKLCVDKRLFVGFVCR